MPDVIRFRLILDLAFLRISVDLNNQLDLDNISWPKKEKELPGHIKYYEEIRMNLWWK